MFARCNGLFALSLCLATVSFGAEPQVGQSPPAISQATEETIGKLSPLDHLRYAMEQLESVGMTEEAARLREAANQISQRVISERAGLARQIQELQTRSEQLRRLTGTPDKILCRCCFLELSSEAAKEFEMAAEPVSSSSDRQNFVAPADAFYKSSVYKNGEEALRQLKEAGRVKIILATPEIVTAPGQRATATSGGEFPLVVPSEGDRTDIEWGWFGVRCEVVPRLLDTGRLQLEFAPEIKHLNFKHAVKLNGQTIPGLTTRFVSAQAEMNLGETLVIMAPLSNAELDTAPLENNVTLFMVTPVASE